MTAPFFEPVRTLAFGSVGAAYTNVGSALTSRARGFCFSNDTDANVLFSFNGTADHVWVKAGGYKLWDCTANINPDDDDDLRWPIGTQWRVKREAGAPTSGNVYIETLC